MAKKSNNTKVSSKAANNPSEKRESEVKTSPWLEDYLDLFSFKMRPVTQAFIERLANELNEWSKKETSLVFVDFYGSKDIPEDAYFRWVRTYPELKSVHAIAKKRLAGRREVGGLTRKFDPTFAWNSLGKYDDDWKEFVQWRANLKQDDGNQQKVVVEINDLSLKASSEGQ